MAGKSTLSKSFFWVIMGLLFIGLAGFGATSLTGTVNSIGQAGDQEISVQTYARDLQREIQAFEAQTGERVSIQQAREAGLDQIVLARLVQLASLDNEAAQIGLSIGDANLQKEIIAIPAFQGVNGEFDREAYRFGLEQAGLDEAEFEADLRAESARTLMQGGVMAGIEMPATMADALVQYIGAERSFVWAPLTAADLAEPLAAPTQADLNGYYEANPELFTLPETKEIAYVLLTPEMLLDKVEVDEAALRTLYEEREAQYNLPERRFVERLAYGDQEAAASAMAQLEVSGTTFEQLVADRGLALADVDLGDVTLQDLGAAAEAVFAAQSGAVVGPLPSDLGPALFRVNGVLEAQNTPFEQARDELRDEVARERARRLIDAQSSDIDDLLAGGATLDEVASETDAELGTLSWTAQSSDGVAAYEAFRREAAALSAEDFPAVAFTDDGGLFAMELTEVLPPRPEPFEQAQPRVEELWRAEATQSALREQAEAALAQLGESGDFAEAGLSARIENGLTRTSFIEGTGPDFMNQVFEMTPGETRILSAGDTVQIVRLEKTAPAADTPEMQGLRRTFSAQMDQALAQELFAVFARDAQLRARPQIDQRAISLVQNNFQ